MGVSRIVFPLLVSAAVTSAQAEDRPWWQFWGGVAENAAESAADAATASVAHDVVDRTFNTRQKEILRAFLADDPYYRGRHDDDRYDHDDDHNGKKHKDKQKSLPPGLRKKLERGGELPPGWQKKLARGEVVDADIWRQSRRLPPDVIRRLGYLPPDTELRYIEDKVYRVVRNTREIVDILGL